MLMCVRSTRSPRTQRNRLACDSENRTAGQGSQDLKTRTTLAIFGLIFWALATLTLPDAFAGPANRRASTEPAPSYPINLDGFGAPLPAVASSVSDLSTFATGQLNFKEIDEMPQLGPLFNGTTC